MSFMVNYEGVVFEKNAAVKRRQLPPTCSASTRLKLEDAVRVAAIRTEFAQYG